MGEGGGWDVEGLKLVTRPPGGQACVLTFPGLEGLGLAGTALGKSQPPTALASSVVEPEVSAASSGSDMGRGTQVT